MALNVIWLDDPASGERELVGGKAANLNQLHSGGQVPLGFCITASATARVVSVRSGEASLPPDLYAEIEAAYAELGARCGTPETAVAVRSSAVAEDGAVNSFAGQYQTLLNVVGVDAVAAAIVECVEKGHLLWQVQQHLTPANKELLRAALRSRKEQGRWDGLEVCRGAIRRGGSIPNYFSRRSSVASGIFSMPTRLATSKRSSRYLCGVS